jgi:hypothetical protein
VDAEGRTREAVYDVAGNAENGASVDPVSLEPVGAGAAQLCTVWEDPDFDPTTRAFYYARILENPTPRWSTLQCRQAGVDVFAERATCQRQARTAQGLLARYLMHCCPQRDGSDAIDSIIQERAWTSPIWYAP